jgi:xanthine dehydrogenase accessory factor
VVDERRAQGYIVDSMNADSSPTAGNTTPSAAAATLGGQRAVIESALQAINDGTAPTLALVLETSGSTYVSAGAIALFDEHGQTGWLSGGCLEPEIARRAALAAAERTIAWMEIDTRDDEALFGGSAIGCRGTLRLALLPLDSLRGWSALARLWIDRCGAMQLDLTCTGSIGCRVGEASETWQVDAALPDWSAGPEPAQRWQMDIEAPASVVIFGAGPEAPMLLQLLRSMGWMTTIVECRQRWLDFARLADTLYRLAPARIIDSPLFRDPFAALVMHHNFELDLETLLALSTRPPQYIGLLGPNGRRNDLFRLLSHAARERMQPHLHSPIGIDLGGRGPEAIALSIAAQLQSKWHGR